MSLENDWAVDDPRVTRAADQIVVFLDVFLMSGLFFVAGYFALPTLVRHGPAGFVRRKLAGLVIPGALVVLFLNPIWKYVYHLTRAWSRGETAPNYLDAWKHFLGSVKWFEAGNIHSFDFTLLHVWFLTVLIVLYVPVVIYFGFARRKPSRSEAGGRRVSDATPSQTTWAMVVAAFATWIAIMAVNLLVTPYQWSRWVAIGPLLLFESPYVLQYIGYFGLGLYAYRHQWFDNPEVFGFRRYWVAVFCITLVVYQAWVQYVFAHPELMYSRPTGAGLWFFRLHLCAACWVLILTACRRYCNRPHRVFRHLADNSYRTYLLHPAVVVWVQLGFWCLIGLDWLSTFVGTMAVSVFASHLISVAAGFVWQRLVAGVHGALRIQAGGPT